jgi:signal recognition particle GTPase
LTPLVVYKTSKLNAWIRKNDKYRPKNGEDAPHERLLVIDSTTGQNGVNQAKEFATVTKVTGIVLTKTDGTSKGGNCVGN